MGRERTKLNPVMAWSSMFMISSFFLFRANISSRVMSRVSIKERSSSSFLLPKIPSSMDLAKGEAALVTKALVVGAMKSAAIPTSRVRAMVKREADIVMVVRIVYIW